LQDKSYSWHRTEPVVFSGRIWSEVLRERRDDPSDYRSVSVKHGQGRKPSAGFTLAHRYAELEICLHVHFLVRHVGDEAPSAYYCAVYEWADPGLSLVDFDFGACGSPACSFDGGVNEVQPTVFVPDIEFADVPKDLANGGTVVRLHPLDQCKRFWRDAGKLVWVYGSPRARILEDWERWTILRNQLGSVDECVGGVIEGGTERVRAFPDEARPLFKRRMLDDLGSPQERMALAIRVVLNEHSVRVTTDKGRMFVIQLAEVFFCPLELHPSATERISHGEGA
jgi:hypothetical protein